MEITTITKMLASLALYANLFFLSPLSSDAKNPRIPNQCPLYVFGDSVYDTGSGLYVDKGPTPANALPYGETYFKKPAGRFSDGRLIPDFLASFANLPFSVPYPNPNFTAYEQAVNFAGAAAGVLEDTRPDTLNLKLQTDYFVEMAQKLATKYGASQSKTLLSRAVYLFNIGANDYAELYNQNKENLTTAMEIDFKNQVIGNLTIHITTMYNKGARKFGFQGLAPVGCLPLFLQADGSCTEEINKLARMHNAGVKAMCKKLARQLPGFKYSIYDFYTSINARRTNGPKYGFTETHSACCGSGLFNGRLTCSQKNNFTACSDPSTYLWFDAGHPTEKADKQFAQEFWDSPIQIVKPRNLKSFFLKNLRSVWIS